jgi:hypothetical protein
LVRVEDGEVDGSRIEGVVAALAAGINGARWGHEEGAVGEGILELVVVIAGTGKRAMRVSRSG